jgi:hypothetical protein
MACTPKKQHFYSEGVKTKLETMQTTEETLFANRKRKEKNARSNYPRTPFQHSKGPSIQHVHTLHLEEWAFEAQSVII